MVKRKGASDICLSAVAYAVLLFLSALMIYPFWNLVVISFNDGIDALKGGLTVWPRAFTLEKYTYVFKDSRLIGAFKISVLRTVTVTVGSTFITSMFAYAVSRQRLKFRKTYMKICTITMYVSAGLIPSFLLMQYLHLTDTFWVYVFPALFNAYNMIIYRSFFDNLPDGLLEAAKIDGAGEYRTFFSVVLPVSKPVIATLALFTAVTEWNDWFKGAIYVKNTSLVPLQTLLRQIINTNAMSQLAAQMGGTAAEKMSEANMTTRSLSAATIMISTIPIIAVYPFLQKYFASGVMLGAVKG